MSLVVSAPRPFPMTSLHVPGVVFDETFAGNRLRPSGVATTRGVAPDERPVSRWLRARCVGLTTTYRPGFFAGQRPIRPAVCTRCELQQLPFGGVDPIPIRRGGGLAEQEEFYW
jgi:hypothetical protein